MDRSCFIFNISSLLIEELYGTSTGGVCVCVCGTYINLTTGCHVNYTHRVKAKRVMFEVYLGVKLKVERRSEMNVGAPGFRVKENVQADFTQVHTEH